MSYPSITSILAKRGLSPATASAAALGDAMYEAFHLNLPLGLQHLQTMADEAKTTGARVLRVEDPNSPLGKEIARLAGTDIARRVLEEKLGVAIGLYNCCAPVVALTRDMLAMNLGEQISLQTSTNC